MSRFFLDASSSEGNVHLVGEESIVLHVRGWAIGVQVRIAAQDGIDIITVSKTGGSHDPVPKRVIAQELGSTDTTMEGL